MQKRGCQKFFLRNELHTLVPEVSLAALSMKNKKNLWDQGTNYKKKLWSPIFL